MCLFDIILNSKRTSLLDSAVLGIMEKIDPKGLVGAANQPLTLPEVGRLGF